MRINDCSPIHPNGAKREKASQGNRGDRATGRNPKTGASRAKQVDIPTGPTGEKRPRAKRVEIPTRPTMGEDRGPTGNPGTIESMSQPFNQGEPQSDPPGQEAKLVSRTTKPIGRPGTYSKRASRDSKPSGPIRRRSLLGQPAKIPSGPVFEFLFISGEINASAF